MKHAVDYLNIGLIGAALLAAFAVPFELFLFSYAVLGPLHYLTEIGWLHTKGYFTEGQYDYLYLVLFTCLSIGLNVFTTISLPFSLSLIALFSAGAMIWIRDPKNKLLAILSIIFVNALLLTDVYYLAVFLPTLIHVFVFTAAFMLFGALKAQSTPGIASVGLLLLGGLVCLFIRPEESATVSLYIQQSFSHFEPMNLALASLLNMGEIGSRSDLYTTQTGVVLMRFVSFAYTYHYLNWFSKTSIISWHRVPKAFLISTLILWLGSIAIYTIDYRLGLTTLAFLSLLHVYLEFPLNYRSIIGIGSEIRKRIKN